MSAPPAERLTEPVVELDQPAGCPPRFPAADAVRAANGPRAGLARPDVPVGWAEAGVPTGWLALAGPADQVLGADRFGASGPGAEVAGYLGVTEAAVVERARDAMMRARDGRKIRA